jgi:hypothetical protein
MSDLSEHYGISPIGYGLDSPRPYPIIDIVKRMIDNGAFGGVGGPGGGVTDHGLLTGLLDDDHPQYHNDARGDARYALIAHTHNISSITGLQIALDAKVDDSQISTFSLTLLDDADAAAWRSSLGLGTSATHDSSEYALAVHTHTILEVSGLQAALDGKAPLSHTHTASQITDFTSAVLALIPAGSDYNADETSLTEAANTFSIKALGVATGHLQAAAVTYAKIQNVNNDQVLGRYAGSAGTVQEISFTAGARAFSQLPDLTAQKNYLGIATNDAQDYKDSVLVATTGNITLSGEQTIDGILTSASRVLVWQQTAGAQNGIYLSAAGAWTRTTDADISSEVTSGLLVPVENGTANADQIFQLTTPDPITLGTTALAFQSIAAPIGLMLGKTVSTTTYTNILADSGKRLIFTNAAAKTFTLAPQNSVNAAVNTELQLYNDGPGLLTVAFPGVTVNTNQTTVPAKSWAQLKKRANPNTWDMVTFPSLNNPTQWTANQSVAPVTLTPVAGVVSTDATLSNVFRTVLVANSTLANPTNLVNGMMLTWLVDNGTTPFTLAYGSKFKWGKGGTGAAPVLSTTASKVHAISGIYDATSDTIQAAMLDTISAGAGGLTNWTEAVNIASPNATVPVVSFLPNNAAAGVDAVIGPKGSTGSLLAQVPDGTTTGGNKRGGRAVDWQQSRTAATQVASGFGAMILGGINCVAAGNYSIAGGAGATVSGGSSEGAIALGGVNGTGNPTASAQGAIALGVSAQATGQFSLAIHAGNASGYGAIAIGAGGAYVAAGQGAINIGSQNASLTGSGSFSIGGINANSRGIAGVQVQGVTGGADQWMSLLLSRGTANATPTELTTDRGAATATNQIVLANGCSYTVFGKVMAYDVTYSGGPQGGPFKVWEFMVVVQRRGIASTIAIIGTPYKAVLQESSAAAAWDLTFAVDTTNSLLKVLGTGAASKTINWIGKLESIQSQDFNT